MDIEVTYSLKLTKREAQKLNELLRTLNTKNIEPLLVGSLACYSAPELAEIAMDVREKISGVI